MIKKILFHRIILPILLLAIVGCKTDAPEINNITENIRLIIGDFNGVVIKSGEHNLVIYGDPKNTLEKADILLFTDAKRGVTWASNKLVNNGVKIIAPSREEVYFTKADSIWSNIIDNLSDNYRQKTTNVPIKSLPVFKSVKGGDSFHWQGISIKVLDSKGYTEGAVSYIVNIDSVKVAFVGNMIYGDGMILDLYSMQNEISEIGLWGYHGYASRMSYLIKSLEKIRELNPDIIIPVQGPIINNPKEAINKLIKRLQLLYQNYLSINSLRWYKNDGFWGNPEDATVRLTERVLSTDMPVDWMSFAKTKKNPDWLVHVVNSKLIKSKDGTAFLIDCGMEKAFDKFMNLDENFSCSNIDGIFITHYHDDHTTFINKIRQKYKCPAYITKELKDILNHPQSYTMPARTSEPITGLTIVPEGESINWKEFTFTFYYFPGQTIYHDAILIKNNDTSEMIFITGDSFSPSGIDDYCLQNRNPISDNLGYLKCINIIEGLPENCWLENQHIEVSFKFSKDQISFMKNNLMERQDLLKDLFPWDNINYGLDEQWARIYPYTQVIVEGQKETKISVIVTNYSSNKKEFTIIPNTREISCYPKKQTIEIPAGKEGKVNFILKIHDGISSKKIIITSDISFDKWNLHERCESIIQIKTHKK